MNAEPEPSESQDTTRVRKAVEELSEHFDSVQIFCTRHESGSHDGTLTWQFGAGNWFARYGQIRTWIEREEERTKIESRKDGD